MSNSILRLRSLNAIWVVDAVTRLGEDPLPQEGARNVDTNDYSKT